MRAKGEEMQSWVRNVFFVNTIIVVLIGMPTLYVTTVTTDDVTRSVSFLVGFFLFVEWVCLSFYLWMKAMIHATDRRNF